MTKKENIKWELPITDQLKIVESDALNYTIQRLSEGINVKTKEKTETWRVLGYYGTIKRALYSILDRDLLVDLEAVNSLADYRAEVENQYETIKALLKDA